MKCPEKTYLNIGKDEELLWLAWEQGVTTNRHNGYFGGDRNARNTVVLAARLWKLTRSLNRTLDRAEFYGT